MQRIRLMNKTHLVEFEDTDTGLMQAVNFKIGHPDFTEPIKHVVQLIPNMVKTGKVYAYENGGSGGKGVKL
jgi:hypothetical protein